MLGSETAREHAAGAQAVLIGGAARDPADPWGRLLDRYLEGWAEANPIKIAAATAHDYRFNDPLVGEFSRLSIAAYLAQLQSRLARTDAAQDLAIFIRGPVQRSLWHGPLKFFREAPRLGLIGITFITIGARGVVAEEVAYDLNLASELLRTAR